MRLSKKSPGEVVALFDIGSGSVGVGLVYISKNNDKPLLLFNTRLPISYQEIPSFEQLTKSMLSTVLDAGMLLQTEGIPLLLNNQLTGHISEAAAFFTSPWHLIKTKTYALDEKEPFIITKEFLGKIQKTARDDFLHSLEEPGRRDVRYEEPILLEEKIIQTELNGYITANPFKKEVHTARIDLVVSAMPRQVHAKVSEIIAQLTQKADERCFSFTLSSYLALRDLFPHVEDFILLDIRAEITDIGVVRNGALQGNTTIPFGVNYIVRNIAARMHTIPEEAWSLVRAYTEKAISEKRAKELQDIFKETSDIWLSSLSESIATLCQNGSLPTTMFLSVDDIFGEMFQIFIKSHDFSSTSLLNEPFTTIRIDGSKLQDFVEKGTGVQDVDPFLVLEALFFQRILYPEEA